MYGNINEVHVPHLPNTAVAREITEEAISWSTHAKSSAKATDTCTNLTKGTCYMHGSKIFPGSELMKKNKEYYMYFVQKSKRKNLLPMKAASISNCPLLWKHVEGLNDHQIALKDIKLRSDFERCEEASRLLSSFCCHIWLQNLRDDSKISKLRVKMTPKEVSNLYSLSTATCML